MNNKRNVLIYAADVAPLDNDLIFAAAYKSVSPERRKKADKFLYKKDKCLSVGAELVLKKALQEFGADSKSIEFSYGKNLKPYLKENKDVLFNMSHSERYVMCAVSGSETGCDIEKITDIDLDIAKRFFSFGEYKNIARKALKSEQNELFFRYWTLKESFMKTTGLGMQLKPDSFEILLEKPKITVQQNVNDKAYSFFEYDGIDGYKCAACIEAENIFVDCKKVDIIKCIK